MLKHRVITACVLVAIVAVVVFFASNTLFALLSAALFLIGAWEWACLSGLKTQIARIVYVITIAFVFYLVWYMPLYLVVLVASLFWLFALYCILRYPVKKPWSPIWARSVIGILVLAPSWLAINVLRSADYGVFLLISLFLLVWAADIGAYFAGRFWGKHALMPKVSPKKTWEGFAGGLVLSWLVAALLSAYLPPITTTDWFLLMLAVVAVNIYSVTGDLFESLLKRYCDIKDSGKILPGHGGVMDRIDSLTAAAPFFLLVLLTIMFW